MQPRYSIHFHEIDKYEAYSPQYNLIYKKIDPRHKKISHGDVVSKTARGAIKP